MIYFDNAATTRPLSITLEKYVQASRELFANSTSGNLFAIKVGRELDKARNRILSLLHLSDTHRLIFLSGATEGNNLAIKGVAKQYVNRGKHLISDSGEHASVLKPLQTLEEEGYKVTLLGLDKDGKVDPNALREAMDKETILVSILSISNETGAINDIDRLADAVHAFPKAFFHVDATQSMGKHDINLSKADLITFSGHKFGGVKGSGVLIYRKNIRLKHVIDGGSQEEGIRPGTVDVPAQLCMALALEESISHQKEHLEKVREINMFLRDSLLNSGEVLINSADDASPYILNFSLKSKKASVVIEALSERDIHLSSHSACDSRLITGSLALLAMGLEKEREENSIRLSLGIENTMEEAKEFVKAFDEIINEVRAR